MNTSTQTETTLSKETIDAYSHATYIVDTYPPLEFRVDQYSEPLIRLLRIKNAKTAAWITAYNPYGKRQTPEQNKLLEDKLLQIINVKGLEYTTGRGLDSERRAPEESLLLFNIPLNEAIEIGRLVEQNAILWIGEDSIPRLELLL
ncbi:MAG TPA: DUF3293 domain-containing protein [Methylotenera sp.]|nr:DUF3293 domain-containing protein [Methylotenera sp.]